MHPRSIVLGSRRSPLAVAQAELVAHALRHAHRELHVRIQTVSTRGDELDRLPIRQIGGQGVFTAELEKALLAGRVDAAVHSAKDLPVQFTEGLEILAVPPRGEVREAVICRAECTLETLPAGAVVGTCSPRRIAQLRMIRPDLQVAPLRGNVHTRIDRVLEGGFDATVLAVAGLSRLGLTERISQVLELDQMWPAPGQGTLAVQGRAHREDLRQLLAPVHHEPTACELTCERRVLSALHAGCQAPIAVLATAQGSQLRCRALVALPDGSRAARTDLSGPIEQLDDLLEEVLADLRRQDADQLVAQARAHAEAEQDRRQGFA